MATLIDGKAVAAEIRKEISDSVSRLRSRGVTPGLGTLLVGDDPGSAAYVKGKHRDCQEVGIESVAVELPGDATQNQIESAIDRLNQDERVSGFIVQLPLPKGIDSSRALARVDPKKDADGLHPANLGNLVLQEPTVTPCTPAGILELLERYEVPLRGGEVVILGRGITVGRPLGLLLSMRGIDATVTVCHTSTRDPRDHARRADVLVAAAGSPKMVDSAWVKPGAAVIDVGITRVDGRLQGDVDFESVEAVAGWIAPVPGGVGPMTRAMLLRNTVLIAERLADGGAG